MISRLLLIRAYWMDLDKQNRAGPARQLAAAATAYLGWRQDQAHPDHVVDRPSCVSVLESSQHAALFDELHRSAPLVAGWLAQGVTAMPLVGSEFLGFRLVAELGSGAFGRVYLSRQGELAERLVVLKIAPNLFDEPRTLARLQHTHIAPIYSVHQTHDFQAVCMPFVGTTTFADLLQDLRKLPALPGSGKFIIDRLEARSRDWVAKSGCPRETSAGSEPADHSAPLANLSYVEGILWLAARLADGLAHAHRRGIIHRDLKPANILLTDDGQPLLLDFNLSEDNKLERSASAARVRGTLPYMAPEQLAAIQDGSCGGDERTDVYSFGIILYELLTGHDPIGRREGTLRDVLQSMLADRRRLPMVRHANAAVSPAAESIVRHCLEPDPLRRYQTSQELCEDLLRQVEHRPLRYAPDPSRWERARKWTRRHPRLTSAVFVGVVATVLVLALSGAFLHWAGHMATLRAKQETLQARLKAVAARQELHDDLRSIEFLLGSNIKGAENEQLAEGMAIARRVVRRHRVLDSPDWKAAPQVKLLTIEQRTQVLEDMGEVLLLFAAALARRSQVDLALDSTNWPRVATLRKAFRECSGDSVPSSPGRPGRKRSHKVSRPVPPSLPHTQPATDTCNS